MHAELQTEMLGLVPVLKAMHQGLRSAFLSAAASFQEEITQENIVAKVSQFSCNYDISEADIDGEGQAIITQPIETIFVSGRRAVAYHLFSPPG